LLSKFPKGWLDGPTEQVPVASILERALVDQERFTNDFKRAGDVILTVR
jgi:hypothetical protein